MERRRPNAGAGVSSEADPIGSAIGEWDLVVATPIGRIPVRLEILRQSEEVCGRAIGRDETVELEQLAVEAADEGELRMTWTQKIRKPLRLTLSFDVRIKDDELAGISRAGRLPPSSVSGTRSAGTRE